MERLYKRLIPVSNGGDFYVFGVRALCAFCAYDRRRRAICGANAANTPFGLAYGHDAHTARLNFASLSTQLGAILIWDASRRA